MIGQTINTYKPSENIPEKLSANRVIIRFGPLEEKNHYIQLLKAMGSKSIGCTLEYHSFHFTPLTKHCI